MTPDRFPICLAFTLAQECPFPDDWSNPKNFSNDAHDPGGETMCGIIQREYDAYRKHEGLYTQPVRLITKTEGWEIYRGNYWLPHCPDLPPGLDLQFFDASVNMGTTEATRIFQYAVGIDIDGWWGAETMAAAKAIADVGAIIKRFTLRRATVYHSLNGFRYFGKDWERRTLEIGDHALKMMT